MQNILRPFAVVAVQWREIMNKVEAEYKDRAPKPVTITRQRVRAFTDFFIVPLAKFAVYYETVKQQARFDARLGVLDALAKDVTATMQKMMDAYQSTEEEIKTLKASNDHTRAHRDKIKELKSQLDSNYSLGQEQAKRLERIQEAVEKTKAEAYNETIKRQKIW